MHLKRKDGLVRTKKNVRGAKSDCKAEFQTHILRDKKV